MKSQVTGTLLVVFVSVFIHGCATYEARFSPPVKQETNVVLKENDFEWLERNIQGTYSYWSLQLGMFPVAALEIPLGDPRLFSNALADLYGKSKLQTEGKPTQMMNWTLDMYDWYLPIPYITPVRKTATFRADLMQYTK